MEYIPGTSIASVPVQNLVPGQRYIIQHRFIQNKAIFPVSTTPQIYITRFRGTFRETIPVKYSSYTDLEPFAHFTDLEIMFPSGTSSYITINDAMFLRDQIAQKKGKYILKELYQINSVKESGVVKSNKVINKFNDEKEAYFRGNRWYFGETSKPHVKAYFDLINDPNKQKESWMRSMTALQNDSLAAQRALDLPGVADALGIPPARPDEDTEEYKRLRAEIKRREQEIKEREQMSNEDKPAGGSKKSTRRKRRTHKRTRGRR